MFGLGTTELIVILIVALLVLGPKRLPELASGLGKAIRSFRKATRDLTDQVEMDETVRKPFLELKTALRDEPPPVEPPKPALPPEGAIAAVPAGEKIAVPIEATPVAAPATADKTPAKA
jgi:sec-independent protein translocase protein TatB